MDKFMFPKARVEIKHSLRANIDFKKLNFVIEGNDAYEVLCPLSKATGLRQNPLSLLRILANDPAKSRALESVLMELPTMASNGSASDDDLVALIRPCLDGGQFADDDKFTEYLYNLSSDLLKSVGIDKDNMQVSEDKPAESSASESPAAE